MNEVLLKIGNDEVYFNLSLYGRMNQQIGATYSKNPAPLKSNLKMSYVDPNSKNEIIIDIHTMKHIEGNGEDRFQLITTKGNFIDLEGQFIIYNADAFEELVGRG